MQSQHEGGIEAQSAEWNWVRGLGRGLGEPLEGKFLNVQQCNWKLLEVYHISYHIIQIYYTLSKSQT